jgi:hypothetical protein
MISRIRLDAYGKSPGDVSDTLYPHADEIEKLIGREISRGEFVVSRNLKEPEGSFYAFEGRLVLHVDISPYIVGEPIELPAAK